MAILKRLNKFLLLPLLLGSSLAWAGDVVLTSFGGLNTQDNPLALDPSNAQDLLNINVTPGGKTVYKREGYGLHKTLSVSTSAVHGGYYFQDTSGADIQLWANDVNINGSVNGATPVILATITVNSTMQCADSLGFAYCLTSSRNTAVRTAGTTATTTFQAGIPLGTMVAATPDRLVVAGVSGNESTLYFSQANTFTNFTIGINSQDPMTEPILSPGSRITHIRYGCGKILWWKDASFGYTIGADQYTLEDVIISPNIGTTDNSSDEYNGHVYFRGQDNHIYDYDCSNVTRLSRAITPTVLATGRRKLNSWTQTTQADWLAGTVSSNTPSLALSATVSPGDLSVSTTAFVDTSTADFNAGNVGPAVDTTTVPGSVILKTYYSNATFSDNLSGWTSIAGYTALQYLNNGAYCGNTECRMFYTTTVNNDFLIQATASVDETNLSSYDAIGVINSSNQGYFIMVGSTTKVMQVCKTDNWNAPQTNAGWCAVVVASGTYTGTNPVISLARTSSSNNFDAYVNGTLLASGINSTYTSFTRVVMGIHDQQGETLSAFYDMARTGNFTSREFDTAFSTPVYGSFVVTEGGTTGLDAFAIRTSKTSGTGYTADNVILKNARITSARPTDRYIIYSATITATSSAPNAVTLQDVTIVAVSTGVYYSPVNNAPNLSSWGTFAVNDTIPGNSTIQYFTRSSTTFFTVLSSTPAWIAQPKNATVAASTGTYFQVMSTFTVTSGTEVPKLSDFTFNWFEGNAADKAYIKYWNDYVWIAVSSGTAGVNNRILRWDLLNQAWLFDDIAANGLIVDNNNLYFGSPSVGKVFKFGNGVTTDNGSSINSYWKSKNFSGADPFVQNTLEQADFVVKEASATLSVTYQINGSTQTTYNVNLYDSSRSILHRGNNLPGKTATYFNFQFGDNSSNNRWEVLGLRVRYTPLAWKPE